MKIKRIEVYQCDLPYAGGTYHLSGGREYSSFDATFARVITDCGIDGWGESTPFGPNYIAAHARGVRAGIAEIAPHIIGHDPRQYERLYDQMDMALTRHLHAKTAIDVACWDIIGKTYGQPLCEVLGGSTRQVLPIISSIHAGTPQYMRERVAQHRKRGYRGHSIKIGATDGEGGAHLDAERITACLSDRENGEFFLVDANGGMTPEMVLRMLNILPAGLDFVLEAPCNTWRETLSLRRRCAKPMMVDELAQSDADIAFLIAQDAADGFGLKISKSGGLTPARRQRDMARAAGLAISVQETVGSEIAFAALLHLGQTVPPQNLRCILDTRDIVVQRVAALDAPIKDGGVIAPMATGLGVSVDMGVMGDAVAVYGA